MAITHGRPIGFWAKAGLFRNPLVRAILVSSGAIPVKRKEGSPAATNGIANGANGSNHTARDAHTSLFQSTFEAFDQGRVVSLFPEGASYSGPEIQQIKDGAAWLALEYARWQAGQQDRHDGRSYGVKPLAVVPVGIVYTDKARFRSRVCVEIRFNCEAHQDPGFRLGWSLENLCEWRTSCRNSLPPAQAKARSHDQLRRIVRPNSKRA